MDIFVIVILLIALSMTVVGAYFIANSICQRRWKEKVSQSQLMGFTSAFAVSFALLVYILTQVLGFPLDMLCSIAGACLIAIIICRMSWREKIPYPKLIGFTAAFAVSFCLLGFFMSMAMAMTFGR